uniref:DH domain-containing protein n=1 Tax=Amphimedon queenslandica TaxID=400682 RepID=A0A1X7T9I4_AMPQE
SEEYLRVYPPYINYFEVTKEALSSCDRQFPRFHAFLKCNESKPECGRQTLSELLITPVQRIPRIILLLQDLLKRTDTGHIDYKQLEESVEKLKNVMEHINEDKRKTEKQMHMFELIRDIEDVPATVLSSHRWFISRHDVLELNISNNGKTNKPLSIALFLFSDSIEIAKIRSGHGFVAMKDSYKPYRHLEFLTYSNIRSVIDFTDSEDVVNGFGLLVHWSDDPQERLLTFKINGDSSIKTELINKISQMMCTSNCAPSPDMFVWKTSSDILHSMPKTGGSIGPIDTGTIKRAFTDSIKGMRRKVKRTISNRSNRRPFTPLSKNVDQLDTMDESFTDL